MNDDPSLPCDNFICLLGNYELMKTGRGYLVKRSKSKVIHGDCHHFQCWLNKFKVTKTSFGFEFIDKAKTEKSPLFPTHNRLESIILNAIRPTNLPTTIKIDQSSSESNGQKPTMSSMSFFDQYFDNFDYNE